MKKKLLSIFVIFLVFSCEAIFVENISDQNIVLLAPTNNITIANGSIVFNWQEVNDADTYEIQVATPSFSAASQIILDSIITASSVTKSLEIGDYEWRVKGMNSDYNTNYTTHSFTVN